jgi:hypothetical protein
MQIGLRWSYNHVEPWRRAPRNSRFLHCRRVRSGGGRNDNF